jgi:hypothetical protein
MITLIKILFQKYLSEKITFPKFFIKLFRINKLRKKIFKTIIEKQKIVIIKPENKVVV